MKKNMQLVTAFLAFWLGFAAVSPPAGFSLESRAKAPEPTAAVWDLSNLTRKALSDDETGAITQHIRVKLFNSMPNYRWLERGRIEEILDEQKFQASGCADQSCVVEMGQLLGARKMVAGSISRVGDTYSMALNVIDIETGLVDKSVSEVCPGCREGQLYQLAENAVRALSGKTPKKVKSYPVLIHKNRLNLDIKKTGAGLRLFSTDSAAVELRGHKLKRTIKDPASGTGKKMSATIFGARIYRYMARPDRPLQPYLCLEADILPSFKTAASEGDGLAAGAFGGIEYFIGRGVSVQADMGAAYMRLVDKATKRSSAGMEYLVNFGVNIYFNY